jgi:hypothetical protein
MVASQGEKAMGGEKGDGGGEPMRRLIFRAAGRTEEFFDRLQAHYRECKRKDVDAGAEVRVVLESGEVFDTGTARLKNVSPTGALLVDVNLNKGGYPTGHFYLELELSSGGYRGIGFRASPVRFVPEHAGIGVRFEEIFVRAEGQKTD